MAATVVVMNGFDGHIVDYLALRRASGYKLAEPGKLLVKFAAYLHDVGATVITTDLAVAFAQLPIGVAPIHWAHRLGAVRCFARYMAVFDPATQVPPDNVFYAHQSRPTPYLWSTTDIQRLLQAAQQIRPSYSACLFETLFGLLATTGMRIGEVIHLNDTDADLTAGVLRIRDGKFGRSRLIPLHRTTTETLRAYVAVRDRPCPPSTASSTFFRTAAGKALVHSVAYKTFRELTVKIGVRTETVHPRMHDLRHSFAVRTLIDWHQAGTDISANMLSLSNYLGHVSPTGTYWYLSASPELMGLAAARLDQRFGSRPS